jgi:hypothetical protein
MKRRVGLLVLMLASVLALVLAGGGWWLFRSLDQVVASGIRTYGPEITGVPVRLGGVKIKPAEGSAAIHALELGNPVEFKTQRALTVGTISLQLDVASLTKDVVRIQQVVIEQPEVTYEHASSGSNLDVIQRHVEAYVASKASGQEPAKTTTQPKKLIIDHVYIKGARAAVSAQALNGKTMTLVLPDVHITDIGKKTGGATPAEATRQVVSALSQNTSRAVVPLNLGGAMERIKKDISGAADTVKGWFK